MKPVKLREDIPRMYVEEKMSTVEIGKVVGLTPGAVASILEARGVPRRTPKEAYRIKWPNGRFGPDSAKWKGGRQITKSGYFYSYAPDHPDATKQGYVMEHRLVAEKMLGRRLKKNEVPHHINGDKQDNRPENLRVMTRSEHVQLHFDAIKEVNRLRAILDKHGISYEKEGD